ncbi:hypothetical protein T01_9238 [Trichinella spiralis]|uniref:Uncharacterized protein n=1 Tax=Trichinella spiralis TaxID=6334 RepID=A0A0V1C1S1_TRISP|nr:hypothetical protein T01_9238 [Trichinella spiralis]
MISKTKILYNKYLSYTFQLPSKLIERFVIPLPDWYCSSIKYLTRSAQCFTEIVKMYDIFTSANIALKNSCDCSNLLEGVNGVTSLVLVFLMDNFTILVFECNE